MTKEERCLAEAVYFEARSEPEDGQAAVAQVVLNRVKSGLYPTSICGVVYQNRHRAFACQFSFACENKSLRITEPEPWKTAVRVAREVTYGQTYNTEVGGATHYHANYVRPLLGQAAEEDGRHRTAHLLQASSRTDVGDAWREASNGIARSVGNAPAGGRVSFRRPRACLPPAAGEASRTRRRRSRGRRGYAGRRAGPGGSAARRPAQSPGSASKAARDRAGGPR